MQIAIYFQTNYLLNLLYLIESCVMFASEEITSDHKDLIHDVAFDFHGRRMATCSSDQTVKVSAWKLVQLACE